MISPSTDAAVTHLSLKAKVYAYTWRIASLHILLLVIQHFRYVNNSLPFLLTMQSTCDVHEAA